VRPLVLVWRFLLAVAGLAAAALVAASFGGTLHPALDSVAQFRAHLAAIAAVAGLLALLSRPAQLRAVGLVALLAGGGGIASVAPFLVPGGARTANAAPTFALLQMNLRFDADIDPAVALVRALQPDVVTVQEATARMLPAFATLAGYEVSTCGSPARLFSSLILSRHPFVGEASCGSGRVMARGVELGGRAVTVVSEHLVWPWPFGQARDIASRAPLLAGLTRPVLVAGDFNAAPWSVAVRAYAAASGTAPVSGIGATWLHRALPQALTPFAGLPLDNVLVSSDVAVVEARRLPSTRSDHRPVLLRFTLAPAAVDPSQSVAAAAPARF
jgi:endonuclease/exonuclease/phosphatase (EEP) superfamily protein YafD